MGRGMERFWVMTGATHKKAIPVDSLDRDVHFQAFRKFGAGEGDRTLDPDLGKVVLYR